MKARFLCALLLSSLALPVVHAAQQGTFGSTSTGSFTLTASGPATPHQVQVLNLSDVTLTNGSRADTNSSTPGVTMTFCLVENYGGAVQLHLTNANGLFNPNGWKLTSSGGDVVSYGLSVTRASDGFELGTLPPLYNFFDVAVPANTAVTSTAACGTGNIKVNAVLITPSTLPDTIPARTYTDVITIVATPQ